jgi:hypothetical protein
MALYQDPALFQTDYLHIACGYVVPLEFMGHKLVIYPLSLGYGLLFYLASPVIDHIWFGKLLVLILMPVCIIYLFRLGMRLNNRLAAVSLSLIFTFFILATPLSFSIATGLQRSFSVPLLIIFIYYMVAERYNIAALIIFISTLIYLPNFPPTVIAYALSMVNITDKKIPSLRTERLLPFGAMLLASSLTVSLAVITQKGVFARLIPVPITENPTYQAGGSDPMFVGFPWFGQIGIFDTGGDALNFIVMFIFGTLICLVLGRASFKKVPPIVWQILIGGWIMFVVSAFVVFTFSSFVLYLPSRYTRSTLFIAAIYYIGLNMGDFLNLAPQWLYRKRGQLLFFVVNLILMLTFVSLLLPAKLPLFALAPLTGLIVIGLSTLLSSCILYWLYQSKIDVPKSKIAGFFVALITLVFGNFYIQALGLTTRNPSEAERDIYQFVATLPKDAIFAGNPVIMTDIPLFSGRSVLFRELFPQEDAPVLEYFETQYAEDSQTVFDFCQQYQIDYLVIDETDYSPEYLAEQKFFYDPYNEAIIKMVAGRTDFAMLKLPAIFESSPLRVIECDTKE